MTVKVTREAEPQIELYGAYSGQLDGNGRVSLTFTATDTYLIMVPKNAVSRPQLELGAFPTSYIPTAAASVTRNADVASVGVSQFPYSASEGTVVANFDYLGGSAENANYQITVSLRQSSGNLLYIYNGNGLATAYCVVSSVDQAFITRNAVAANVATKLGFAFKANDFAASQDGGAVATDTSGSLPPAAPKMVLGNSGDNSAFLSGHIRQITYIPRRLTNAELQQRTA